MRNIPVITKNLLIINVLVFVATYALRGLNIDLDTLLGLHFILAPDFRAWQFVTYMFMHGGVTHLLMNMFMLWMFGMVVENVWGPKKFLFYYMVCGLGAGVCQELAQYGTYVVEGLAQYETVRIANSIIPMSEYLNMMNTVGASGAIYGVLLAFGMLFPEERMFIIPIPVPIKAKWIVIGSVVVELFSAIGTSNDGVAHLAHLGGMLFGFILIRYWKKHPYSGYGGTNSVHHIQINIHRKNCCTDSHRIKMSQSLYEIRTILCQLLTKSCSNTTHNVIKKELLWTPYILHNHTKHPQHKHVH